MKHRPEIKVRFVSLVFTKKGINVKRLVVRINLNRRTSRKNNKLHKNLFNLKSRACSDLAGPDVSFCFTALWKTVASEFSYKIRAACKWNIFLFLYSYLKTQSTENVFIYNTCSIGSISVYISNGYYMYTIYYQIKKWGTSSLRNFALFSIKIV